MAVDTPEAIATNSVGNGFAMEVNYFRKSQISYSIIRKKSQFMQANSHIRQAHAFSNLVKHNALDQLSLEFFLTIFFQLERSSSLASRRARACSFLI